MNKDISSLTVNQSEILKQNALEIKGLRKRVADDVVKIGKLLTESKAMMNHGSWSPWLETEFGWSDNTALNFMQVHAMVSKNAKFADLNFPVSSLYLLAKPSTTEEAKTEIIGRAKAGEKLNHKDFKKIIDKTKPPKIIVDNTKKEPEVEVKHIVAQETVTPNICAECVKKDKTIDSLKRQINGYKRNMAEDHDKIDELEKKLELFFIIKDWAEAKDQWGFIKEQSEKFHNGELEDE